MKMMIHSLANRKFRAFTLWEMIIVMILLSILVAFSYGVYQSFAGLLHDDLEQTDQVMELLWIEKEIQMHVERCEMIETDGSALFFIYPDEEFCLSIQDCMLAFGPWEEHEVNLPVIHWEYTLQPGHSTLIQSFRLQFSGEFELPGMYFKKQYSRKFLYANKER